MSQFITLANNVSVILTKGQTVQFTYRKMGDKTNPVETETVRVGVVETIDRGSALVLKDATRDNAYRSFQHNRITHLTILN